MDHIKPVFRASHILLRILRLCVQSKYQARPRAEIRLKVNKFKNFGEKVRVAKFIRHGILSY